MRGHIAKKGSQYYFILDIGFNSKGKRKQKWFKGGANAAETRKMMTLKISELLKDEYVEPSSQLYKDYFDEWLQSKSREVKESTVTFYSYCAKLAMPYIGKRQIDKITSMQIETMLAGLLKNHSQSTVRKVYITVNQSLAKAKDFDFIQRNPCEKVKPPSEQRHEMQYWTPEEVQQFMFVARDDPLWIAFFLAIKTGMRRGEILSLRWSDISGNNITVRQSKSASGIRTIAITDADLKELSKHKLKQNETKLKSIRYNDENLIVTNSYGGPIDGDNLSRSFNKILKDNELKKIRFHDLRHTHATMMLLAGVHAKIVSERLGHSSINITLDIYSHVLPNMQVYAAEEFERVLSQKKMLEKC